ncbi:isoleucine--tRNA ligase [Candidatus Daviesbacteria bacterium RIFCSPLOWO2_01_FULL_43_38]|uniref:Isoleucine--tRNA ligase n=1 Tax=Candidatus Daviesbacteria bacterium RIFCSPHIGHO2_12_FULL_43_11 TaxID=1797780 RepID=A0A1F5K0D4_9BACT|nr:MAG: isoleucine--tRNA ligase [Candidatus Daviesbacteria bacterium RIFCSPHIGHO2_12_FULL_43_11]OGE63774.1 MAG: isoleucine--tRNA ligase [Candidatus Daviesbacteria bacterium RIFCSPLOWO2_01_FULL_43_38]
MTGFKPVSSQVDFPALEKEILGYWQQNCIVEKYLKRNEGSDKKFSFLDGPITANNPMGVHHAWGRAYKDLWQRFYNMKGYRQRFQNGFDEQGLWVEVGVEQELGLKSKKDIENLVPGDKFASLEKFVSLCKERVNNYGGIMTEQSKRLGYFMDWDNSYHTSSEKNNYTIWRYLKTVYEKGWLYKGHDSVPWCPRCGTAISQHEISTEEYKELTHESVYIEYPIVGKNNEYLLVWTTTPWTLPANVAIAVDVEKDYVAATGEVAGDTYYLGSEAAKRLNLHIKKTVKGNDLVGWEYTSPFDDLDRVKNALGDYQHRVIETDKLILPITEEEGTGLVHIAPGAGAEDFQIGKKFGLPVIEVINEAAHYLDGMGDFSGQNAKSHPELIIDYLKQKDGGKFLFDVVPYAHRYPTCWRCKTELVWRVVDEWYIAVDKKSPGDNITYREKMLRAAREIEWQPKFVEKRELDWLENLQDWLISKKRYWGLALPIWECPKCGNFEVIGGKEELKTRAVEGWNEFEGHTPHKPWVDQVKIRCDKCAGIATRVLDVGNPWLDAGIVPYSTITEKDKQEVSYLADKRYWEEWFPPEFAVEMYEQTKLWFYAMIAMSSALEGKPPVQRIFGHGRVVDEKGEEMHRSKGNAIWFDEAAEKMGADAMRWLYLSANPSDDLRFGYNLGNEVKRRFLLIYWNCYKFFVDYANLREEPACNALRSNAGRELGVLDKWILAKLNVLVELVNSKLEKYDAMSASRAIEDFVVNDLSTWYIRRSRDRVGPSAEKYEEEAFLSTTHTVLITLSKLLAPFMPFIAEELYRNLTGEESVHLVDFPEADKELINKGLMGQMGFLRQMVEVGHAQRKEAEIKLRQPLQKVTYGLEEKLDDDLEKILADELNVKQVEYKPGSEITIDTNITPELAAEGEARELARQIQNLRKESGLTLKDKIRVLSPNIPEKEDLLQMVLRQTNASEISRGEKLSIEVV